MKLKVIDENQPIGFSLVEGYREVICRSLFENENL
jgi:hypothetical protein